MQKRKRSSRNSKLAAEAKPDRVRTIASVAIVLILISLGLFTSLKPEISGFLISETVTTYEQDLNIVGSQTQTYAWELENTGELRSVSLSGKLSGTGTAKVYLEKDGIKYLILDDAQFGQQTSGLTSITGLVVENKTKKDKDKDKDNTTLVNITEPEEEVIENITAPEENITVPEEDETVAEKEIDIALDYNAGTSYDSDDDGVELTTSAIDFTVENTGFNWDVSEENLCTQWVIQPDDSDTATAICYGSSECCALLEVVPESSNWNDPLAISVGLYGTSSNNTVNSRVIYANYSLELDNIYSDIIYSDFSSLSAEFIEPVPEEVTVIEFTDICEDTCVLSGLNDSGYTLLIEVENATLELDEVTYTIATFEEIDSKPPIVTIFSPQIRIYDTAVIDLNFSIDEPTTDIWYVLNKGSSVTISENTTITAINGSNNLTLYATDLAGNTGSDEVTFSARLSESFVSVTVAEGPLNLSLKPLKEHYKQREDAEFDFAFIGKAELVSKGKWKDEYEEYEDGYEDYLETVSDAKKASIEKAVKEKGKKQKQKKEWVSANETIETFVYDSSGNLTDIEPEIEELRDGKFKITVPKQRAVKPGQYKLQTKLVKNGVTQTVEQDFLWGVMVVNTEKNIYLPGETAKILIGITDYNGKIPSEADIQIEITSPSGQRTILETPRQVRQNYDLSYFAYYLVDETGNYSLKTTASTENSGADFTVEDESTLISKQATDFEISRDISLMPVAGTEETATIEIKSNVNAANAVITEYVPTDFIIAQTDGIVDRTAENISITWTRDLAQGETISLDYTFETPLFTPVVYSLGPLQIEHGKTYDEERQYDIIVSDLVWFGYRWYFYYNNTAAAVNSYIPQDPLTLCQGHNYTIHYLVMEEANDEGDSDPLAAGTDIQLQVKPFGEAVFTDIPAPGTTFNGYGIWSGLSTSGTVVDELGGARGDEQCELGNRDRCYWSTFNLSLTEAASGAGQLRMYTSNYPAAGLKNTHKKNINPITCNASNIARDVKVYTHEDGKVVADFAMNVVLPLANYETTRDLEANISLDIVDSSGNKLDDFFIVGNNNKTIIIPQSPSQGDWSVNVTKWQLLTPNKSIDASADYTARITVQDNLSSTRTIDKDFNFYGIGTTPIDVAFYTAGPRMAGVDNTAGDTDGSQYPRTITVCNYGDYRINTLKVSIFYSMHAIAISTDPAATTSVAGATEWDNKYLNTSTCQRFFARYLGVADTGLETFTTIIVWTDPATGNQLSLEDEFDVPLIPKLDEELGIITEQFNIQIIEQGRSAAVTL